MHGKIAFSKPGNALSISAARQVGAAIGIATFSPLRGTMHNITHRFVVCVIVCAAATAAALGLTALKPSSDEKGVRV